MGAQCKKEWEGLEENLFESEKKGLQEYAAFSLRLMRACLLRLKLSREGEEESSTRDYPFKFPTASQQTPEWLQGHALFEVFRDVALPAFLTYGKEFLQSESGKEFVNQALQAAWPSDNVKEMKKSLQSNLWPLLRKLSEKLAYESCIVKDETDETECTPKTPTTPTTRGGGSPSVSEKEAKETQQAHEDDVLLLGGHQSPDKASGSRFIDRLWKGARHGVHVVGRALSNASGSVWDAAASGAKRLRFWIGGNGDSELAKSVSIFGQIIHNSYGRGRNNVSFWSSIMEIEKYLF